MGNNFAVNAAQGNNDNDDFWIICCIKPLHTVKEAFICKWACKFEVGNEATGGYYYQKWGTVEGSFVLLQKLHMVYMHAHLVRAVKFLMPPKDHRVTGNDTVYTLLSHAQSGIMSVLHLWV